MAVLVGVLLGLGRMSADKRNYRADSAWESAGSD